MTICRLHEQNVDVLKSFLNVEQRLLQFCTICRCFRGNEGPESFKKIKTTQQTSETKFEFYFRQ